METQGFIKIDRSGRTLVFGEPLKRSLCHQAGYYSLSEVSSDQVSFKRVPSIPRNGELREPIVFQGDIAGIGSTIEVVNFVISARLTGQITFVKGEVRKSIFLKEGEVSAARSNHLDDRLSEILFRFGALEREAIDRAEEICAQSNQPLGNYLIRNQVLSQGQLYLYFKKQVEEIFFSILMWNQGDFYFTTSHFNENPTPLKLNAQQLLLEGVKRADEMKRYREKIPSENALLKTVRVDKARREELSEELKALLNYLETPQTVKHLINYFRVGEFNIYQRVFQLLSGSWIELSHEVEVDQHKLSLSELIMLFNRTFAMIEQFANQSGVSDSLNTGLKVFMTFYNQDGLFEGVSFSERGRIEEAILIRNLKQINPVDELTYLGQALCELLYIQIFAARTWLSQEEHGQLRDVYEEISALVSA